MLGFLLLQRFLYKKWGQVSYFKTQMTRRRLANDVTEKTIINYMKKFGSNWTYKKFAALVNSTTKESV